MRIKIDFCCDNAAFEDDLFAEIEYLLYQIPEKVRQQLARKPCVCTAPESADKLFDSNGNSVGSLKIKER